LSALTGTLTLGATTSAAGGLSQTDLVSTKCAILSNQGNWHIITFAGSTTTTLTTCSYSGSTSETVSAGAPVCQIDYTVGGAYPYWVATVVDPSCPKVL
jgi:hypothetical protein